MSGPPAGSGSGGASGTGSGSASGAALGSGIAQASAPKPSTAAPNIPEPRGFRPVATDPVHVAQDQERQTFRRRRMVDAACALPFLGLLLWWLPLLWRAPQTQITTAQALIYIFSVWVALPTATGLLILAIRRASAPDRPEARR